MENSLPYRFDGVATASALTSAISILDRQALVFSNLPRSFQDAVTVTRELEIRLLWIEPISIIQRHEDRCTECPYSADCPESNIWDIEREKMEVYFGSSYDTLTTTSATDPFLNDGFLECKTGVVWLKLPNIAPSPDYINDFHRDAEDAPLNKRRWVLQERALSRWTIYFASA
ncbi:hypothetical protein BDV23DRAFT_185972 [Aspergillus alliaceus]|uniref:Heterokaryon incompatibility domain-containing protein n=1 Tax=Petromyces alliaceus TaxID=209559 RepID=A0A5N7C169_PETAA|nr:hypothetical protein BDV23DRAFT_185972 [Aspergillus alliaceus]